MIQVTQKDLMPGVHLTAVHTEKFKTCLLGATLLTSLRKETASLNALVPFVLRRGTERAPDMEALSAALDELYGGSIEPNVRKKGSVQCIGFTGSFLDDTYTPGREAILEPAAALLGGLLLHPVKEDGGFRREYVEGERANLVDRIRAQVNDKRQYSVQKLIQLVCAGEPAGVDKLGDESSAAAITADGLWEAYWALLRTARVELYYCGSAPLERVEAALAAAFRDLPREKTRTAAGVQSVGAHAAPGGPRLEEEAMDVTQGKLALGFRTGGLTAASPEFPALLVMNAVYGGTPTSKLFLNVREKLSLCYYASSMLEKFSGLMVVSSGIEFDKFEAAKAEILAQMENCRAGTIEEWELVGARQSVISALRTTMDAQGRLEEHWLGQAVAELTEGPDELARRVEAVTMDQVVAAARRLELDTVYFLKGREGKAHG